MTTFLRVFGFAFLVSNLVGAAPRLPEPPPLKVAPRTPEALETYGKAYLDGVDEIANFLTNQTQSQDLIKEVREVLKTVGFDKIDSLEDLQTLEKVFKKEFPKAQVSPDAHRLEIPLPSKRTLTLQAIGLASHRLYFYITDKNGKPESFQVSGKAMLSKKTWEGVSNDKSAVEDGVIESKFFPSIRIFTSEKGVEIQFEGKLVRYEGAFVVSSANFAEFGSHIGLWALTKNQGKYTGQPDARLKISVPRK